MARWRGTSGTIRPSRPTCRPEPPVLDQPPPNSTVPCVAPSYAMPRQHRADGDPAGSQFIVWAAKVPANPALTNGNNTEASASIVLNSVFGDNIEFLVTTFRHSRSIDYKALRSP